MRQLYTIALRLALPFILLRLWWRGRREPGYREGIPERFGFYAGDKPANALWIHAVSVGEARAAAPLVRALKTRHAIVMTCTTATGRETIRKLYGDSVHAVFLPYDYPETVQAFLEHFRPRLGVIMETELWPNVLHACARRAIPVLLANARMSDKSARRYQRWRGLTIPALRALSVVCAQSEADAARLRALGAPRVVVAGNLKFDAVLDGAQLAAGREWRAKVGRPVILLASTREGEERELLAHVHAGCLTVVVPRHPQRFDEVAQLAQSRRTRSALPGPDDRVHLGDTMGEMAFYYGACDVAIVGGSFAPYGGQNLIEALAAGAPVIVGPSMYNFAEPTALAVQAGAAMQAPHAAAAMHAARQLLADHEKRQAMGEAGRKLCETHRGATERHLALCRELIA